MKEGALTSNLFFCWLTGIHLLMGSWPNKIQPVNFCDNHVLQPITYWPSQNPVANHITNHLLQKGTVIHCDYSVVPKWTSSKKSCLVPNWNHSRLIPNISPSLCNMFFYLFHNNPKTKSHSSGIVLEGKITPAPPPPPPPHLKLK